MNERLQYEGHLTVLQKKAKDLEIQLNGLVKSLRENLDMLEKVRNLDGPMIAQQAMDFAVKQSEYKETLAGIAKAKDILGRDEDRERPSWP